MSQTSQRGASRLDHVVTANSSTAPDDVAELVAAEGASVEAVVAMSGVDSASGARQALEQEQLELHTRVHGIVVDRAGTPLIKARVRLATQVGNEHFDSEQADVLDRYSFLNVPAGEHRLRVTYNGSRSEQTDVWGRFSFVNVPAGKYSLQATYKDSDCERVQVTVDSTHPVVEQDIKISGLQCITVDWVLPDGTPVRDELERTKRNIVRSNARVVASPSRPGSPVVALAEDSSAGTFRAAVDPGRKEPIERLGTICLTTSQADFLHLVIFGHTVASVPITDSTSEVEFVMSLEEILASRAGLRFQVTSTETGEPLLAEVIVLSKSALAASSTSQAFFLDGRVQLSALAEGENELQVSAEGFATNRRLVTLTAGETLDLGIVALQLPLRIEGQAHIDFGAKTECSVRAGPEQPDGSILWAEYDRTHKGGHFELSGVEPGRWGVQAFYPFDPGARSSQGFYVGLQPGRLEFHSPIVLVETTHAAALDTELELGQN